MNSVPAVIDPSLVVNVGARLSEMARQRPDAIAVAMPLRRDGSGRRQYRTVTFGQLEDQTNRIAAGLVEMGVTPGTRLAVLVPQSIEFISLVFALFKSGAVSILIDPGMGRKNLLRCLEEARPEGFVAVPIVHAARSLLRRRFLRARLNVTVGRRWVWGGKTLTQLLARPAEGFCPAATQADDPAAIIFTTGSTGPPKGVLYRHGNFDQQVEQIRDQYGIRPGESDLPGFPLFGLFNAAMGVTTVLPDMDPTRPALVDPRNILEAVRDWQVTQAFGSPAIWNAVGRYCERHQVRLPTLRRVLSAGAPVPPHVLSRMQNAIADDGQVHTPYGATEALPVATISSREVLGETAAKSRDGAGTCVGRRFPGIQWKVIQIVDGPLPTLDDCQELPTGQIGELIVRGAVVTREYVTRVEANALAKIADGAGFWHRMGDVGYLDEQDRFWFCGRKAHRLHTARGEMFTIPCEAIINRHEQVYRSALVGVIDPHEPQAAEGPPVVRPVIVAQCWPEHVPATPAQQRELIRQLQVLAAGHPLTSDIRDVLLHPALPVDIRHNAKIFREKLAVWAAGQLGCRPPEGPLSV